MAITVEALELNVQSSAGSAANSVSSLTRELGKLKEKYGSIGNLASSITRLKEATKGGLRLSGAANQIERLGTAVAHSINQSRIGKLNDLAKAMNKLKRASSDFKVPSLSAINRISSAQLAIKDARTSIKMKTAEYTGKTGGGSVGGAPLPPNPAEDTITDYKKILESSSEAEREYAKSIDEICKKNKEAGKTQDEYANAVRSSAAAVKRISMAETNALAESVTETERLRRELKLSEVEFNNIYNKGGWSKAAIKKSREIESLREKIADAERPVAEPIEQPETAAEALQMKAEGLAKVAQAAADAGNGLKTANAVLSEMKTSDALAKMADGDNLRESLGDYRNLLSMTTEDLLKLGITAAETKAKLAFDTGNMDQMLSAANGYNKAEDALNNYRSAQQKLIEEQAAGKALLDDLRADGASQSMISFAEAQMKAGVSANTLRGRLYDLDGELKRKPGDVDDARTSFQVFMDAIKEGPGVIGQFIKNHTKLLQQFGRVAKMRAMRAIIRGITAGLKEGIGNLYQYSKAMKGTFASAMDAASTSILYMKNSIATAVAPLIEALVPVLDQVVEYLVQACNWLAQFFARLNGQSSWTRAKKSATEYAEAAKKGADNTKDMLAAFDELNVIQSESNNGNKKTTPDYKDMFETVKLDESSSAVEWADKISNFFGGGSLGDILTKIGEVLLALAGIKIIIKGFKFAAAVEKVLDWLKKRFGKGGEETPGSSTQQEARQATDDKAVQEEARRAQEEVKQAKDDAAEARREALEAREEQARLGEEATRAKLEQSRAQQEARLTTGDSQKITDGTQSTSFWSNVSENMKSLTSGVSEIAANKAPALTAGASVGYADIGKAADLIAESGNIAKSSTFWSTTADNLKKLAGETAASVAKNIPKLTAGGTNANGSTGTFWTDTTSNLKKLAEKTASYAGYIARTTGSAATSSAAGGGTIPKITAGDTASYNDNVLDYAVGRGSVKELDKWNSFKHYLTEEYPTVLKNKANTAALNASATINTSGITNGVMVGNWISDKTTYGTLLTNGVNAALAAVMGQKYEPTTKYKDAESKPLNDAMLTTLLAGTGHAVSAAGMATDLIMEAALGFKPSQMIAHVADRVANEGIEVLGKSGAENPFNEFAHYAFGTGYLEDAERKKGNKNYTTIEEVEAGYNIPTFDAEYNVFKLGQYKAALQDALTTTELSMGQIQDILDNADLNAPIVKTFGYEKSVDVIKEIAELAGNDTYDILKHWDLVAPYVSDKNYGDSIVAMEALAENTGADIVSIMKGWKFVAPFIDENNFAKSVSDMIKLSNETGVDIETIMRDWEFIAPYVDDKDYRESMGTIYNLSKDTGVDVATIIGEWKFVSPTIQKYGYEESAKGIKKFADSTGLTTKEVIDHWRFVAPAINQSGFEISAAAITKLSSTTGIDIMEIIKDWELIAPRIDQKDIDKSVADIATLIIEAGPDWRQKLKSIPLATNPIYVPDSDVPGQVAKQAGKGQTEAKKATNKIELVTKLGEIASTAVTSFVSGVQKSVDMAGKVKVGVELTGKEKAEEELKAILGISGKTASIGLFNNASTSSSSAVSVSTTKDVSDAVTSVKSSISNVKSTLKTYIDNLKEDLMESLAPDTTRYETKWHDDGSVDIAPIAPHASGAYDIPSGQLFLARERGPELVGKIGTHSSVANNDQIVSGIAGGVASAMRGVEERLARIEQYAGITASKDPTVKITPSAALGRVNAQAAAMYGQTTGR